MAETLKRRGAGTITGDDVGTRVRLQAWVQRRRDHGGVIFLNLRDRSGIVQVVVTPEYESEAARVLDPVRNEWVVEVEGDVVRRSPENVNRDLPTGEVEVIARNAQVLSRSEPLPFALDGKMDGKTEVSEEVRLR